MSKPKAPQVSNDRFHDPIAIGPPDGESLIQKVERELLAEIDADPNLTDEQKAALKKKIA